MRKLLEACPCCGGSLGITGLACTNCDVEIKGRFRTCDFCRLTDEQSTFLRLFVQRRGNLSEMEKALGISYPTVRNKLEEIIRALEVQEQVAPAPPPSKRDMVLQQVASGQLSAESALELLSGLTKEDS
ncbi:MAG: hypothetical protein JWO59_392 [Chloroflexi bacterium]|jgi:hypothetical protein|nr:hypothetical protein [Chloroflexota bacterium]MDB5077499.1 hypothetical protein [Chloroflexota bacterium]